MVVIDPPYEDAADFIRLSGILGEVHRKWPTGIYLLWYPIKERDAPDALARRLRRLGVPKMLRSEITLRPPSADFGLAGSGLIAVNPPFTLDEELRTSCPRSARTVAAGGQPARLAGANTGSGLLAAGSRPLFHTRKLV